MPLLLGALLLVWAAMLVLGGSDPDKAALLFLYAGDRPGLVDAARAVTALGSYPALIGLTLLGVAGLALRRDWRGALLLIAITLSGRLLVQLQKDWTGRLRPEDQEHLVATQSYAFPSGHAANAMLVLLSLALLLPASARGRRLAVAAAAIASIAVGLSRPILGVHWPSDVVAGWALGLFWTLLLLRLSGRGPGGETAPAPGPDPDEGERS